MIDGLNVNQVTARALAEIEPQLRSYLASLPDLVNGTTSEKETLALVAYRRLKTLSDAAEDLRQQYEIPLLAGCSHHQAWSWLSLTTL